MIGLNWSGVTRCLRTPATLLRRARVQYQLREARPMTRDDGLAPRASHLAEQVAVKRAGHGADLQLPGCFAASLLGPCA